jgi:hypothetical protein
MPEKLPHQAPDESPSNLIQDVQTDRPVQTDAQIDTDSSIYGDEPEPPKSKTEAEAKVILFWLLVVGSLILVLMIRDCASNSGSKTRHAEREYLGVLQKITYVGSFGVDTQIETESQTLLLRGSADLNKGARLERREGLFDIQVCVVGTDSCWGLRNR